jgi:hypothetical protein
MAPVVLSLELCFRNREGDGAQPMHPTSVYLPAINVWRSVSAPSRREWTPFSAQVDHIIGEDINRLNGLDAVQRASVEVRDYTFPNGVVGKVIVYHIEERDL